MIARACLIGLLTLAATTVETATSDLFPRPRGLEPDIAFWVRIYTELDTQSGVIHDSRHLDVIYETVRFAERSSRHARNRQVKNIKERYRTILQALARGQRQGLGDDEQRVLSLWGEGVSNQTLAQAARRLRFQLGQSDKFREGLIRAGAWKSFIRQTLAERGLPEELAALPHVESSFNPYAYSKVGAAGLWQFTRSTGRRYMQVDHVIDERMDPFLATEAAARLLEHNYASLGSWPLAIIAYNHGAAGMRRAVRTQGTDDIETIIRRYDGRRFGFASRNFYIAFLAAVQVDANAEQYFGPLQPQPAIDTVIVEMSDYFTVDTVARTLGVERDVLEKYNLALRPTVWNGNKYIPRGYGLRVPRSALSSDPEILLASVAASERYIRQKPDLDYRVRRGDTLTEIASDHGVSVTELVALNGLRNRHRIRAGQVLKLPVTDSATVALASSNAPTRTIAPPTQDGIYVVRRGDSISRISRKLGVDGEELLRVNGISDANRIYVGQELRLHAAEAVAEAFAQPTPAEVAIASSADSTALEVAAAEEVATPADVAEARAEPPPSLGPPSAMVALVPEIEALQTDEDAFETNALATAQPVLAADPSDYTVANDGSIEVQAVETLGHYADWLEIRTQRLRDINGLRFGRPVVLGRRITLDFSRVDRVSFEQRRVAYHRALQEEFFLKHRITDTITHQVRRGESMWVLAQRRYEVPVWLLRQYNPDVDLDRVRPGAPVIIPVLEPITAAPELTTST